MTRRKLLTRAGAALAVVAGLAGTWAAVNRTALEAAYAARQLRAASADDARTRAADKLAGLGDHGLARLVELVRAGDEPCRTAAAAAIDRRLAGFPAGDPWAAAAAGRLFGAAANAGPDGRRAVLELLPALLKAASPGSAAGARAAVGGGLASADAPTRVLAVRLALHPDLGMRRDVVPLLGDPEPSVRRAALAAVATGDAGEPLLTDEDLFRWLHDADDGVRKVCHSALTGRGRTETEIAFGRRLTHPDPRERLALLLDLRYDQELADPGPWLERLGRDAEPAVRAGAARVAAEVTAERRSICPGWVARVADADPDPTVRRVARYFRNPPPPAVRR